MSELDILLNEILARCYHARGDAYKVMAEENFDAKKAAQASSIKVLMNRFIPELEIVAKLS